MDQLTFVPDLRGIELVLMSPSLDGRPLHDEAEPWAVLVAMLRHESDVLARCGTCGSDAPAFARSGAAF